MPAGPTRSAVAAAAIAYGVQAVLLAALLIVTAARTALPVVATFTSDARTVVVPIASVDLGWAVVAVLAGGAVTHALVAGVAGISAARPERSRRPIVLLLAGWSQGAAILVFLVAQLNGIAELTSLVPLYAIASTAVALLGIDPGPATPTWQRPGAWAAAVGIVPWGVIAFAQIGAGIAVGEVPFGVRIVTLVALAVAVLGWVLGWRRAASVPAAGVIVMTVGVSVLAWSIVVFSSI